MKKRVRVGVNFGVKDAPWFDSDCREAKRNAKHLLKAIRKETPEKNGISRDEKRLAYVQARKEYRRLIKKLQTSIKNSKVFWGEIRSSLGKRQSKISEKISSEEWSQHDFSNVRISY